jgi:hypothetical protein
MPKSIVTNTKAVCAMDAFAAARRGVAKGGLVVRLLDAATNKPFRVLTEDRKAEGGVDARIRVPIATTYMVEIGLDDTLLSTTFQIESVRLGDNYAWIDDYVKITPYRQLRVPGMHLPFDDLQDAPLLLIPENALPLDARDAYRNTQDHRATRLELIVQLQHASLLGPRATAAAALNRRARESREGDSKFFVPPSSWAEFPLASTATDEVRVCIELVPWSQPEDTARALAFYKDRDTALATRLLEELKVARENVSNAEKTIEEARRQLQDDVNPVIVQSLQAAAATTTIATSRTSHPLSLC